MLYSRNKNGNKFEKQFSSPQLQPIEKCATYLRNKSPYLRYDQYLSAGGPIATGVIEGACRHLVKDRMEITGAKWRLKSAEAVLRLRALRISHNFEEYWEFHEACEHKRNHQDLYSGGVVPATISTHPPFKRNHSLFDRCFLLPKEFASILAFNRHFFFVVYEDAIVPLICDTGLQA